MPVEHDIHFEKLYPHPPELVWRALTDPDALARWMVTTTFRPDLGAEFSLETPGGSSGGTFEGVVTVLDAPHRLAYTLTTSALNHATTVTWTLMPQDGDTLLTLDHTGFSGMLEGIVAELFRYGWQTLLSNLRTALNDMGRETSSG